MITSSAIHHGFTDREMTCRPLWESEGRKQVIPGHCSEENTATLSEQQRWRHKNKDLRDYLLKLFFHTEFQNTLNAFSTADLRIWCVLVAVESLVLHGSTEEANQIKYMRVCVVCVLAAAGGWELFHGFDWRPKPIGSWANFTRLSFLQFLCFQLLVSVNIMLYNQNSLCPQFVCVCVCVCVWERDRMMFFFAFGWSLLS